MTKQITEREWEEQYNPLNGPDGSQKWEFDEIPKGTPNTRVWSYVEGDDNALFVLNGYHVVNVEGYAITENGWLPGDDIEVAIEGTSDRDKAIEEIALILWYDGDAREWTADKEWDSDTLQEIAQTMIDRGLAPSVVTDE